MKILLTDSLGKVLNEPPEKPLGYENWLRLPDFFKKLIAPEDAWALHPDTRKQRFRAEAQRRKKLANALMKPGNQQERIAFKHACAASAVFHTENCIWTRDPENRMGCGKVIPLIPYSWQKKEWLDRWQDNTRKPSARTVHEKSRRMGVSIFRIAFELKEFRFSPGSLAWMAREKESMVDGGEDWFSLFGKFRFMWKWCRHFYPWLYPPLPSHSEWNQSMYLKFPEWVEGGVEIDPECWDNELIGCIYSSVAGRGGAAGRGFGDEAGYADDLGKHMDSIQDMTPDCTLASTPPPDSDHYFVKCIRELAGWDVVSTWWTQDPVRIGDVYWDEEGTGAFEGEWRGPNTQKWRSSAYDKAALDRTSQEMARNWDGNYEATAGSRVFLSYVPDKVLGSTDPKDPSYDYYDPNRAVTWWYDPGRGDPWAWIAAQIDPYDGTVYYVDYLMADEVIADYFIPIIMGWSWSRKDEWLTAPERLPWFQQVQHKYPLEFQEKIRYWHGKVRPRWIAGDIYGEARHSESQLTVAGRFREYGLQVNSISLAHKTEERIDHSNEVLRRTKISGRLVGYKPLGRWPSLDECLQYWRRGESNEAGKPARPLHNVFSHTGTSILFGSATLPAKIHGQFDRSDGHRKVDMFHMKGHYANRSETGWMG